MNLRPSCRRSFNANGTAVRFHEPFANREAEATSGHTRLRSTIEFIEDTLQVA